MLNEPQSWLQSFQQRTPALFSPKPDSGGRVSRQPLPALSSLPVSGAGPLPTNTDLDKDRNGGPHTTHLNVNIPVKLIMGEIKSAFHPLNLTKKFHNNMQDSFKYKGFGLLRVPPRVWHWEDSAPEPTHSLLSSSPLVLRPPPETHVDFEPRHLSSAHLPFVNSPLGHSSSLKYNNEKEKSFKTDCGI